MIFHQVRSTTLFIMRSSLKSSLYREQPSSRSQAEPVAVPWLVKKKHERQNEKFPRHLFAYYIAWTSGIIGPRARTMVYIVFRRMRRSSRLRKRAPGEMTDGDLTDGDLTDGDGPG